VVVVSIPYRELETLIVELPAGVPWYGPEPILLRKCLECIPDSMLANRIEDSLDTWRLASRSSAREWQTTGRGGWRVARDGWCQLWFAIRSDVVVGSWSMDGLKVQAAKITRFGIEGWCQCACF